MRIERAVFTESRTFGFIAAVAYEVELFETERRGTFAARVRLARRPIPGVFSGPLESVRTQVESIFRVKLHDWEPFEETLPPPRAQRGESENQESLF